jgi:hypothetical protein
VSNVNAGGNEGRMLLAYLNNLQAFRRIPVKVWSMK